MHEEIEVGIKRQNGQLYGTLLSPSGAHSSSVSIIISGSGPTDRNGNQKGLNNDSLKKLATGLYDNNCASFRIDKRGIGKSTFPLLTEFDVTIDAYVEDIVAIADVLKNEYGFKTINLIGHSEGGLISLLASTRLDVDKIVLIAAPASSLSDSLIHQYNVKAPHYLTDVETALCNIQKGVAPVYTCEHIELMFRPSVIPYIASCYFIEPIQVALQINRPIAAIYGDNDYQVGAENAELFKSALGAKALTAVCKGMNHVLVDAPLDIEGNMASYNQASLPLHPELVSKVLETIKSN